MRWTASGPCCSLNGVKPERSANSTVTSRLAGERLVEVERAEALLEPLALRGGGDREEADRHQQVPLPPAQLPARRERGEHDHQRLGQQREGERDREGELGAAPRRDPEVLHGREPVGHDADQRERPERRLGVLRRDGRAQRRELGQRQHRPQPEQREDGADERAGVADDRQRGPQRVLDRGRRREQPGDHEPDRRRQHEPGVPLLQQHARRGERVQPEEPGAGQEREPDQQQPRVLAPAPGLAHRHARARR